MTRHIDNNQRAGYTVFTPASPTETGFKFMAMLKVSLPINVLRCRDTKQYIVHSPALDLSSSGKTESEAMRMFGEAVRLFLSELERMGTTADVLTELGWRKVQKPKSHWVPPELLHHKSVPIKLPVSA